MNNSIIVRESEANREPSHCHCEERSDEAISKTILLFLSPYSRQASEVDADFIQIFDLVFKIEHPEQSEGELPYIPSPLGGEGKACPELVSGGEGDVERSQRP